MDKKSRMKREFHVRFCEGLRGKYPRATRPRRVVSKLGNDLKHIQIDMNDKITKHTMEPLFFGALRSGPRK